MKNLYRNMLLVAAAAMSFTSCSEDATEDVVNPEVPMMDLTINAQIDDTRVTLNEGRTGFQWTAWADEKLGIFTDVDNTQHSTEDSYTKGANFSVKNVPANATKVYAYYPLYENNSDKAAVSIYVSNSQYQAQPGVLQGTNAIDNKGLNSKGKASSGQFPMIAAGDITNGTVLLSFRPVACALALNIYDDDPNRTDEKVTKVTFTPKGTIKNHGAQYIDITKVDNTFVYEGSNTGAITVTLGTPAEIAATKPDTKTNPQQVYICTARVNYTQGGTITVTTDKGTDYTFDIAKEIPCANCDLLPISLNLKKVRPEPVNIPEGDYVVLGVNNNTYYAMSSESGGSNRRTCVEFAYNGTDTEVTTDNEKIVWHIAKGTKEGEYNFSTYAEPKQYINSKDGETGVFLTNTSEDFSVENNGDGYTITSKIQSTRRLTLKETTLFGFYTSSTGTGKVYLVPAKIGVVEKCTIDTFTADWADADQTKVALSGTYTSTYATELAWTLTVSKDNGAATELDAIGVDGTILVDNYTLPTPGDGTYVFTLTATVDGTVVATKTAEITKTTLSENLGKAYSYTFTQKVFSANGTQKLGELPWTLAGNGGYWGYDTTKGQQFGSSSNPYKNMTLTLAQSDYQTYSSASQEIQIVKVNTSGGSKVKATLTVTVGGVQIGEEVNLTSSATEYTFTAAAPLSGDVVLTYTQTSSVALYIKSISIN